MLKWLWLSGLVALLDQITKWVASAYLVLYKPLPVLPMFNLTLFHNTGAAFSFLNDAGGWQRWFFTVIALGVSAYIVFLMKQAAATDKRQVIALALILGGAVGNVIDRISYGYVVDFIQVYYEIWYFPAFNLADSAITIGAILFILDSLLVSRANKVKHSTGPQE